jgi:hypothetical protein
MKRVNFHLDDDQIKRLRKLADAKGVPVAELIRRYVDAGLDRDEKRKNRGEEA